MKLRKVISGGQTGADKTGLICAKELGLETGGTAPKGYRTEKGADYSLRDEFGLVESNSSDYKPRTYQNAADGDVTVWFGKLGSPGYWCTKAGCNKAGKEFYENPTELQLEYLANSFEVWNVAGNRESKNPAVVGKVRKAFNAVKKIMEKENVD
jgi:hypothetical protein